MKSKKQQLNCLIPISDYNLFKGVAFLKGRKINEAIQEAIALWIKEEKSNVTQKN